MSGFWNLNLIHLFDFYLMLALLAGVVQRFERYQSLSPEQRQRMDRNLERWRSMTPEERQRAREQIREKRQERQKEIRPREDAPARRPR